MIVAFVTHDLTSACKRALDRMLYEWMLSIRLISISKEVGNE